MLYATLLSRVWMFFKILLVAIRVIQFVAEQTDAFNAYLRLNELRELHEESSPVLCR